MRWHTTPLSLAHSARCACAPHACCMLRMPLCSKAVPERINLFRAQASRAVGGNGRRTSHNPPDSSMLDIYDRVGIVVMDENRLFDNNTAYVNNMGSLVKRDRNHPAVVIWSFCNEGACEGKGEHAHPRHLLQLLHPPLMPVSTNPRTN